MQPSSSSSSSSRGGRLVLKGHGAIGSGRGSSGPCTATSYKRARVDPLGVSTSNSTSSVVIAISGTTTSTSTGDPKITRTLCTGQLRTSATAVSGIATRFLDEIKAGDVIEVGNEARPVAFVLSATSLGLSEPFSVDVAVPARFTVAHLVVLDAAALDPVEASRKAASARFADVERQTGAGARIQIKGDSKGTYSFASAAMTTGSREDQLDARAKTRGRDKFC